ncbi:MAG: hypothetical protein METHP_01175 [Methanoregula sp. SKADARSKE-2]|nr:MAG: hypothetical protein METHP_01175 [Methanoregula sp. SKADARSKE-2]
MVEEYNVAFASTGDAAGGAGWKILKKYIEGKEKYQDFIHRFPDTPKTQDEVGEFVREEMRLRMENRTWKDVPEPIRFFFKEF